MADAAKVVEGKIKFREGKKWKSRWCVLKKPSPVADRLQVSLFKDVVEVLRQDAKPKSVFALEGFLGLDAGFRHDREAHVMAIICQKNVHLMAFEIRENMIQFEIKIRQSLGEEHQFPVRVVKSPSNSRLPKDNLRLFIHDSRFCLLAFSPPKVFLSWNVEDLRRFGARDGKFCYEGGTRCGKGSGVFALESEQAEDIADIINLASTGKMSNCHRKFKNRSSQIDLGSHLIADMSSLPSPSPHYHHHHPNIDARAPTQGALPTTLNCCHNNQTGSADSEDWSWYKRHSVSVMDHRRIAALREKGYLENRDQLAGIYDVPPSHSRVLGDPPYPDSLEEFGYSRPRPHADEVLMTTSHGASVGEMNRPVNPSMIYSANYKKIQPRKTDSELVGTHGSSPLEQRKKRQSASADNLDERDIRRILSEGVELNPDVSTDSEHHETLLLLRKEESDLQREMILLDEMDEILQVCAAENEELTNSLNRSNLSNIYSNSTESSPSKYSSQSFEALSGASNSINNASHSNKVSTAKSPLLPLDQELKIISGNITTRKKFVPCTSTPQKADRATALRLNTSMPEGNPVSPMFHAKLHNIPQRSHLNAPLPYVNLSQYDDESHSHVHLPGSADCVPVTRGTSMQGLNTRQGKLRAGHTGSLTSLNTPVAASSLTNLSMVARDRELMRQRQIQNHATAERHQATEFHCRKGVGTESTRQEHQEILVVNMTPQGDGRIYSSQRSLVQDHGSAGSRSHVDLVNILTTDANTPVRQETSLKREEIYENLPPRNLETPPPELPPKGPALLKKIRASSSQPPKNTALSSNPASRLQSSKAQNPAQSHDDRSQQPVEQPRRLSMEREEQRKQEKPEDNYLMMGSPKLGHKLAPVTEKPAKRVGHLDFVICSPAAQNGALVKSDYIDMENVLADCVDSCFEDEIYLDVEEARRNMQIKDLYISEADLKINASPVAPPVMKLQGESTYMEMASVTNANRKSLTLQGADMPQVLPLPQKAATVKTTLSPPLPLPPKVRHNSDSGVPLRRAASDVGEEPTKKKQEAKPVKSPMKIYTKVKSQNKRGEASEPPMPFPNLIEFTKKMSESRSTYVNTYVDASQNLVPDECPVTREVLLPLPPLEPHKEGFLARLKRRSSKDKGSCQVQEKTPPGSNAKNRTSVLERSMSEHESSKSMKEEKGSKLKLGRRRSSSFPNRLSYQESVEPIGAPCLKPTGSSSSSFSSGSYKQKSDWKPTEQSESSSSIHDLSDDSDMSPLLKRDDKKIDSKSVTLLHVQRTEGPLVNPYLHTSVSVPKFPCPSLDLSKTDDEKLLEMKQQKIYKKPVIYQRSSSLDLKLDKGLKNDESSLSRPSERKVSSNSQACASSICDPDIPSTVLPSKSSTFQISTVRRTTQVTEDPSSAAIANEDLPPSLPPKSRTYQNPLSPVIETAFSLVPPSEPVYVEMDEVSASVSAYRAAAVATKGAGCQSDSKSAPAGEGCHVPSSSIDSQEDCQHRPVRES